ncbi:tetratricopeptide repeat protein [Streptomyces sp. RPA4-5]|uniref:trypco2 family protein n=1 Tax=unclassified Streptomyces TaxID=2593676 RepID=UPI00143EAEA5|nr:MULTISPECIES: trypco2 family protein [unclassified Streptomyces]QIY58797.1 tetratricopeptide repeat protein [Streptomyces sp. RPA4-5]WJY42074.1 tetratricopeptide repeat protein [Streptomyces sp. P9-2B-2]
MSTPDRKRSGELDRLRAQAEEDFGTYGPQLADRLLTTCQQLRAAGEGEEALLIAQEAVGIHRALVDRYHPVSVGTGLAHALLQLGLCLAELGAAEEAVDVLQECLAFTDVLAAHVRPPALRLRCNALECLALILGSAGRTAEAVAASHQAITGYRELFEEDPGVAPELARGLHNLATLLAAGAEREQALIPLEESLVIYDQLSIGGNTALAAERSRAQQLHAVLTGGEGETGDVAGEALSAYHLAAEADAYSATSGLAGIPAYVEIHRVEPVDHVAQPHREQRSMDRNRIDLTEAVQAVRDDLRAATESFDGGDLQFDMGPIELEFTVELERDPRARSGVRTWVVTDAAAGKASAPARHRLTLTLTPRQLAYRSVDVADRM